MLIVARMLLLIILFLSLTTPCRSAQPAAASRETLGNHIEELNKNPSNIALREKIIALALTMKPAPTLPENAASSMARGVAFARTATDADEYIEALVEFEAAANSAPWLALAYYNLGVVQERIAFYADAIQSLKLYLIAAPDAPNIREVRNKIDELEANEKYLKAGKNEAAPESPASESAPDRHADARGKTMPAMEPAKQLNIISLPPAEKKTRIHTEKKARKPSFIGNWLFKDHVRGEERTVEAFEISINAG